MKIEAILVLYRDRSPVFRQCLHRFVEVGHQYGYKVIALAPEGTTFSSGEVDFSFYFANGEDKQSLRAQVKELCFSYEIYRILVLWENDVYTASLCREDNGIDGLQPEHAILFRDKNAMNERATELRVRVPEWCQPNTIEMLKRFAERVRYPVVLKPYDGMGCINTYKANSAEELETIWPLIRNERHNFRVERFVQGKQFHLDSLVQNGSVVFELLSEYTYNLLDGLLDGFQHNELVGSIVRPFDLSAAHQQMFAYNRKLLDGFGLSHGVTHAEFYLTENDEVYFGEVGARMGGVYIVPMVEHACGLHLAREWARMELDGSYYPSPRKIYCVGGVKITSQKRGKITAISPAEELKRLDSVVDAQIWKRRGDILAEPTHSADILGYYLCAGETFEDVYHKLRNVYPNFRLEVEID